MQRVRREAVGSAPRQRLNFFYRSELSMTIALLASVSLFALVVTGRPILSSDL